MASKTKQEYLDEATALGIDVDELGEDSKDPTIPELQAAIAAVTDEVGLSAGMFLAHHPTSRTPFAGLLAAEPHLQEAELSEAKWHHELKKYLNSERP